MAVRRGFWGTATRTVRWDESSISPRTGANSGVVWLVDLETYAVAGRVTEVGNESYLIGTFKAR